MEPWRDGSLIPEGCKQCPVLSLCGGGCRIEALTHNGSLDAMDPLTSPTQAISAAKGLLTAKSHKVEIPFAQLPQRLRLNPLLRFRLERFGSIVDVASKQTVFLNQAATDILFKDSLIAERDLLADKLPREFLTKLFEKKVLIGIDI
jgi:hypothetical protein